MASKKIYRSTHNRIIAGVAAGLAEYFETDPVIVRVIFIFLSFAGGSGFIIYFFLWVLIPERSQGQHMNENMSGSGPNNHDAHAHEHDHDHNPLHDLKKDHYRKHYHHGVGGFLLIIIGIVILVNNIFPSYEVDKYWPLILIFFGAAILLRKRP